jgi:curved DNA-binding protein CbpA
MASATNTRTHYEVLGVKEGATEAEIKAAYKAGALVHHPNKGGSNAGFKRLGAAYDVLKDQEQRRDYDLALVASRVHASRTSKKSKTSGASSKGGAGGGHNNSRGAGGGANAPKCSKDDTLTREQKELIKNLKNATDLHSDESFDGLEEPIAAIMAEKRSGRDLTGCREFIKAVKMYKRANVDGAFQQQKNDFIRTHGLRKAARRSRKARKSRKNRRTQRR